MHLFEQMMFVSGETGEPAVETTTLIEEVVRRQVHSMVGCQTIRCFVSSVANLEHSSKKVPTLQTVAETAPLPRMI